MRPRLRTLADFAIAAFVVVVFLLVRPMVGDPADDLPTAGSTHDSLRILAPAEREKVEGHGRVGWSGDFDANIWNGSRCAITGFYYRLVPRDSAPAAAATRWQAVSISPQRSARVRLQGKGPRWFVDSVQGRCPTF